MRSLEQLEQAELFDLIAVQRRKLADLADELSPDQLEAASSCDQWRVVDVLAHLLAGPRGGVKGLLKVIGQSGFSFDAANIELARRYATQPVASLAAGLRSEAENRFVPPGFGPLAPLSDIVIHSMDICVPLGLRPDIAPQAASAALTTATMKRMRMVNSAGALTGFSVTATDLDWHWGSGPEVSGPSPELAHALWGRTDSLDSLQGDGVHDFSARIREQSLVG